MGKREVLRGYEELSVEPLGMAQWPLCAAVKHLKCPGCQHELEVPEEFSFDKPVQCERCGEESEVRVLHEEWCRIRRAAFQKPP